MISILPLLALTGCGNAESVSVYLFFLGQIETLSDNASLSHNFSGAYEPEVTDDWTRAEDTQTSSQALFGELVTVADGTVLLQIAGQTYPGSVDKGAWTFSWEDYDRGTTSDTHVAGYSYTTDYENSRKDTLSLIEDEAAGTLGGTWATTTTVSLDQHEDDTWSTEVGLVNGQIVIGGALLVEDEFGTERAASNTSDETDCTGSPCLLSTSNVTETERIVQGILTDYTPEDLEQDVDDYGQNEGF